ASINFVVSLGFKFSVEDIIESLNEFSVDAIVRLREIVPDVFSNGETFVEAAFDSGRLSLIKYAASIFPSDLVFNVAQAKVYELLFQDSLHLLDWIYKTYPKNIG